MTIRVVCKSCGAKLKVKDELGGAPANALAVPVQLRSRCRRRKRPANRICRLFHSTVLTKMTRRHRQSSCHVIGGNWERSYRTLHRPREVPPREVRPREVRPSPLTWTPAALLQVIAWSQVKVESTQPDAAASFPRAAAAHSPPVAAVSTPQELVRPIWDR